MACTAGGRKVDHGEVTVHDSGRDGLSHPAMSDASAADEVIPHPDEMEDEARATEADTETEEEETSEDGGNDTKEGVQGAAVKGGRRGVEEFR